MPINSTEYSKFVHEQGDVSLELKFHRLIGDNVATFKFTYKFMGIRAFRHTADYHCGEFDVEEADCKLIEITDSSWVEELKENYIAGNCQFIMKHYMFHYPDDGTYEFIAESWESLPEERIK